MQKIYYEWDRESLDLESGDIIDHDHSDKCPGIPKEKDVKLVLVRDVWTLSKGLQPTELLTRAWAYVDDQGFLPTHFEDANGKKTHIVPDKFKRELQRTKFKMQMKNFVDHVKKHPSILQ